MYVLRQRNTLGVEHMLSWNWNAIHGGNLSFYVSLGQSLMCTLYTFDDYLSSMLFLRANKILWKENNRDKLAVASVTTIQWWRFEKKCFSWCHCHCHIGHKRCFIQHLFLEAHIASQVNIRSKIERIFSKNSASVHCSMLYSYIVDYVSDTIC